MSESNQKFIEAIHRKNERIAELERTEKVYYMNRNWIADAKVRIAELEATLEQLAIPKVPQSTEVRDLVKRIAEMEREPVSAIPSEELRKACERFDGTGSAVLYLTEQVARRDERIKELEGDLRSARIFAQGLERGADAIRKQCGELKDRIAELEAESAKHKADATWWEQSFSEMHESVLERDKRITDLEAANKLVGAHQDKLNAYIDVIERERDDLKAEVECLRSQG